MSHAAKSNRLFEPGFVYPSDEVGPYTELHGEVVEIGEPLGAFEDGHESVSVLVRTERGEFTGWYEGRHPPKVGNFAKIRLYRSGGGWYPDDRIVGWSVEPYATSEPASHGA